MSRELKIATTAVQLSAEGPVRGVSCAQRRLMQPRPARSGEALFRANPPDTIPAI